MASFFCEELSSNSGMSESIEKPAKKAVAPTPHQFA